MRITCAVCASVLVLFLPVFARAESNPELANCTVFRVKRDGVPVYVQPETSSAVLAKLPLGELVCQLGERCLSCESGPFSIVDWHRHDILNKRSNSLGAPTISTGELGNPTGESGSRAGETGTAAGEQVRESVPELVYIRSVDLWRDQPAPASANSGAGGPRDLFSQTHDHVKSFGGGLVPEDIYGPFRPFIDSIHSPTRCRAGAICKRVEEIEAEQSQSAPKNPAPAGKQEAGKSAVGTK